jgi:hypothetical protein
LVHVVREVDAESQQVTDSYIFARKIKAAADGWRQDFQLKKVVVDLKGTESLVAIKAEPVPMIKAPTGWPDRLTQLEMLEIIQRAWDKGEPLSMQVQMAKFGRYAPTVIHRRLQVPEDIVAKIIEQWQVDEILKSDTKWGKTRNRITGLTGGPKKLPMSGLAAMPDRSDFVPDRGVLNRPTKGDDDIVDIVGDGDFG